MTYRKLLILSLSISDTGKSRQGNILQEEKSTYFVEIYVNSYANIFAIFALRLKFRFLAI